MSTPGADPGGDYAAAFLDRLTASDPDGWQGLRDRCISPFGATLPKGSGSSALDSLRRGEADLLLVYATTAARITEALPGAQALPLPPELAPLTEICACARNGCPDPARDFLEALQGPTCAEILRHHSFLPA